MDQATQDYFRAVEDHFIRRRERPLLLSPADVGRVKEWHESGIPLAAVLEGIDVYFERMKRRDRAPRRAVTLAFCEDDVLEAWAGVRHRRLGRRAESGAAGGAGASGAGSADSAALATAAEHARLLALLEAAATRLEAGGPADRAMAAAVSAARAKLLAKAELFDASSAEHDDQKAEDHLRRLEKSLASAAREAAAEALPALEAEVQAELAGKRAAMSASTLERVTTQLLDKKLRQRFGLERLSLFYA